MKYVAVGMNDRQAEMNEREASVKSRDIDIEGTPTMEGREAPKNCRYNG